MMLTAGIELAEGKSSLAEPGAPGGGGTDDSPGVRSPAPVVASGAGAVVAVVAAPEPFGRPSQRMRADRGLEHAGFHIGHDARGVAQQPQFRAIGPVAAARRQDVSHQTVTVGFEPAPQPLDHGLVARIALGQRGARREQR